MSTSWNVRKTQNNKTPVITDGAYLASTNIARFPLTKMELQEHSMHYILNIYCILNARLNSVGNAGCQVARDIQKIGK